MLSHLGNLAKKKAQEMKAVGVERVVSPMFIHSYHNGHQRDMSDADQLGYSFNTLALSAADVDELHRTYLEDESIHLTVPMKTIYRIIALGDTEDIQCHVDLVHKVLWFSHIRYLTQRGPYSIHQHQCSCLCGQMTMTIDLISPRC